MRPTFAEQLRHRDQKRRKAIILAGALIFLIFIATTLFGDSGILVNLRAQHEYRTLREERDQIVAENRRLKEEIRALRNSTRKIEETARREFGFGRPGEVVFYFPEDPKSAIQEVRYDKETAEPTKGEAQ